MKRRNGTLRRTGESVYRGRDARLADGAGTRALNRAAAAVVVSAAGGRGRGARGSTAPKRGFDAHFTCRTSAVAQDVLAVTTDIWIGTAYGIGGTLRGAVTTIMVRAARVVVADLWLGAAALAIDEDAALRVHAARRPWLIAHGGRFTTRVVGAAQQLRVPTTALIDDSPATDADRAACGGIGIGERIATAFRGAQLARRALTGWRGVAVDQDTARRVKPGGLSKRGTSERPAGDGRATVWRFTPAVLPGGARSTVDGLAATWVEDRAAGICLTREQWVTVTLAGRRVTAGSVATTWHATVQGDVSTLEVHSQHLLAAQGRDQSKQQRRSEAHA